jgi:hypothetical protein
MIRAVRPRGFGGTSPNTPVFIIDWWRVSHAGDDSFNHLPGNDAEQIRYQAKSPILSHGAHSSLEVVIGGEQELRTISFGSTVTGSW